MKENILLEKSFEFAVRIVNLNKYLKNRKKEHVLSKQLLRSGTSIGANVCEAIFAQSRKDFVSKMNIALKESYETEYWLELLYGTGYIEEHQYLSVVSQCRELTNILAAIVKTSKVDVQDL